MTLIADMLKAIAEHSQNDRDEFIKEVTLAQENQQNGDLAKKKKRLAIAKNRAAELEKLICKIYEDSILGKLPEARYAALDEQYAKEQTHQKEVRSCCRAYQPLRNLQRGQSRIQQVYRRIQRAATVETQSL